MKVLVRPHPRTLYIATKSDVLTIRSSNPRGTLDQRRQCIVELLDRKEVDLTLCRQLSLNCYGCLGLLNVDSEVYLCVITDRSKAATPSPGRTVWRIHAVEFICLRRSQWDFVPADDVPESGEHPCTAIKKFFSTGGFYYSTDFDLTAILQNSQDVGAQSSFSSPTDESFMWNCYMMHELGSFRSRLPAEDRERIDKGGFLTCVIRGYTGTRPIQLDSYSGLLSIISRQSWLRAGTRYNSRGIDDEGNVANFVETETVLWLENYQQFGYVQLRGSVPVFWEQDANLLGSKLSLTRSFEATQPAFRRHYDQLTDRFGAVHIVNLLSSSKLGEADLCKAYRNHVREQDAQFAQAVRYTHFDFHREVSNQGYSAATRLVERVQDSMLEFGFYSYNPMTGASETEQIGIFRTNCLDCLDRTNLIQQLLSKDALDLFFDYYNLYTDDDLWATHAELWADNGDQLSVNYAGTGALKSSFTRSGRMNLAGALSDVTKSVGRLYVNNFQDKARQGVIEVILGRGEGQVQVNIYDPIIDYVRDEMKNYSKDFTSDKQISMFVGTFNVNGKELPEEDGPPSDLNAWLFPPEMTRSPDVYLIAFQELVELTTAQILNVDSARKAYWEDMVGRCLNRRHHYVLMRSGQLVGTALMMFVKYSEMESVTMVEGTSKKTALGGMAGNKGGVAVSFLYDSTNIMFISAHLAAGLSNLEERHQDYKSLATGLRFARGKRARDMDTVVWAGDFNYRVDLPNETVRGMMEHNSKSDTIRRLQEHDQLISQMERGETFPFYDEGTINFLPTYKFDPGTDDYDTSDKARTPAWTDRILTRGNNLHRICYNSAPSLKFSDHRPVYAIYDVTVALIDKEKRERMFQGLYEKRRKQLLDPNFDWEKDMQTSDSVKPSKLPHPSTDTGKWWVGEGIPARVPVVPPKPGMVLNPEKINPFTAEALKMDDFVDNKSVRLPPMTTSSESLASSKYGSTPSRKPVPSVDSSLLDLDDSESGKSIPYRSLI